LAAQSARRRADRVFSRAAHSRRALYPGRRQGGGGRDRVADEIQLPFEVDASLATYDQTRSLDLYRTLEERLAALPGVERASISSTVPFGLVTLDKSVQRGGANPAPDAETGHRGGRPRIYREL
jgi:hypothetical protein